MTNLIFGCGYLGARVATRWRDGDQEVTVVTRSEIRAHELTQRGFSATIADITRPETLRKLPVAERVLFAVGYDRSEVQSIEQVYAGGVRNVLAALPNGTTRFIYISTTGVYGPGNGEWVDELTTPDPRRDGGRASLAAEEVLAEHPLGKNSVVLRLAGIYGPGRIPFIDKLRGSEPIPAPTTGHLNLIQVDDAATAVVAAGRISAFENGPRVYCVSDGHPVERGEFYREVARRIGAQPPTFVAPEPGSPRAMRAESNRRVCNTRMLNELGVKLKYDNYRAGLAAILETQNQ
jgi:nucleoside-diphosphate-sugar epimerase